MPRQAPQKDNKDSIFAFISLFLYTAAILIRPHEMLIDTRKWIIIKVFAILCFIAVLIGQRPLKLYPQHWMLLALIPLIIISGFLNGSGMIGIDEAIKLLVSATIPLFLISSCTTSLKRQHVLMFICLTAAMLMVHNGHVQQTSFQGNGWALYTHSVGYINLGERRITYLGFFSDPNDLGMFLVMCIPFTIYFYCIGKFLSKITMLLCLAFLIYGIYLTGSRGTMTGTAGLIAIFFLIKYAGPKLMIASAAIGPVLAVGFTALQRSMDESANQRLEAWYHGIHLLLSNPLLGVGKQQFREHHGRVAHNSYIHISAELGTIGYSLWGGALILTVLTGYLILKNKDSAYEKTEAIKAELLVNKTLFFSMIGFLVTAFFISRSYTLLLYVFLGMMLASTIRLIKLNPYFSKYFENKMILQSIGGSWIIIVVVYIALKLGL